MDDRQLVRLDKKKPWEKPEIVLERSLVASAQGGPPGNQPGAAPGGFLAPLNLSPSTGGSYCL